MEKTKTAIVAMIVFLLASLTMLPAYAIHANYYDFDSTMTGDTAFGGTWSDFYSTYPHQFQHKIVYDNSFAQTEDETAGFQHAFMILELDTSMKAGSGRWVKFGLHAGPTAADVGAYIKAELSASTYECELIFYEIDGTEIADGVIIDYSVYNIGMKARWALDAHSDEGDRDTIVSVLFYKIRISDGQLTELDERFDRYAEVELDLQCKFYHFVEAFYGYSNPSVGTWSCTFGGEWDIGYSHDVHDADFDTDIFDVVTVSGLYGSELGVSHNWTEWIWDSNCWKADLVMDYEIDIYDITEISTRYEF